MAKAPPKAQVAKKALPKLNIHIKEMSKITKPIPVNVSGSKYGWLADLRDGECMCIPMNATNATEAKLKTAITGAARRMKIKVVCSLEKEGFCVWRKGKIEPKTTTEIKLA